MRADQLAAGRLCGEHGVRLQLKEMLGTFVQREHVPAPVDEASPHGNPWKSARRLTGRSAIGREVPPIHPAQPYHDFRPRRLRSRGPWSFSPSRGT